jgi:hypothetical protein
LQNWQWNLIESYLESEHQALHKINYQFIQYPYQ